MPEFTPEQQQIEDLVERCLDEAGNALETNEGLLFDAIMNAERCCRLVLLLPNAANQTTV